MADGMTRRAIRCAALAGLVALGGCGEDGGLFGTGAGTGEDGTAAASTGATMEEREVEAPDVFQATETGLWDGRPTFGGVWIAHPDAANPERVAIVNTATGKRVTGALFRRERERPGPKFEVSSDAATELGLIAGQPQELSVVALKTEAVPVGPSEEELAGASAAAQGVEDISMAPLDAPGGTDPGAAPFDDPVVAAPGQAPAPRPGAAAAPAAAPAPVTAPAAAPVAAAPVIEPAGAPPAGTLDQPYVQVGLFSEESNALAADTRLREAGIIPTLLRRGARYRLIVGPARSVEERDALLLQVQNLGFTDAYYVTD